MNLKNKLIEVALPLDAINQASAREKSIRHGHPSTLHLWWARRPLAAARAVIFAQMGDGPSAHPERFPTEEAQEQERQRLFRLIEKLSSIVHSWKSFTAKQINAALGRRGAVWQEDYYDRMIRNEEHWEAARRYIRDNPVKAKLCAKAEDWPFGSAWERGHLALGEENTRAGRPRSQDDIPLAAGGVGATAYAEAVGVYLGFALSMAANIGSSIASWMSDRGAFRETFARQAIPMVWDYAEANPFADAGGSLSTAIEKGAMVLEAFPAITAAGATQSDATTQTITLGKLVSTDPPYYDNIGYADLSDFFYVWLRRSLRPVFPDLFATLAVPKAEELVATPYRHGSTEKAEAFFLNGMTQAMHRLAEQAHPAFPVTIYYAFKQSESESDTGAASTGWETFLDALICAGFAISGTWPVRTEGAGRIIAKDTNALASSIVLVCRRRPDDAPITTRRDFLQALKRELPDALKKLQHGNIAPVDLAQSAIGPGMAIFTRYAKVLESDDSTMTVRTALQLINQALDEYLSEQEGEYDADTRFAITWFETHGMDEGPYGVAETLATARGVAVSGVQEAGILIAKGGKVRLLRREELPENWNPTADTRPTVWEATQHLIRTVESKGEAVAGALISQLGPKPTSGDCLNGQRAN